MWRTATPEMIERERLEKLDRERRAELHRKAVVNAVNSILKEWTKRRETAKLIGDYPPKKWSN